MNLLQRYSNIRNYKSYDDFCKNFKLNVPENFNFGRDVVDEYARLAPQKRALVWCNDKGAERVITFSQLKELSDKAANLLISLGIKKGDFVMTMLNRRWEYWVLAVACHKLGAPLIPATFLLTAKDIEYRVNTANVKLLVVTNENDVINHVKQAEPALRGLKIFTVSDGTPCTEKTAKNAKGETDSASQNAKNKADSAAQIGKEKFDNPHGYPDINSAIAAQSGVFTPPWETHNDDLFLTYFTSGTTGYPKPVSHKFTYPLGFILNAAFWQCVQDDGLHYTMAETGWAKFSWGAIYGQWIAGCAVFAYDYFGKFTPTDILPLLTKYKVTSFCAPPTIYRFLIKENLGGKDFKTVTRCATAGEPLSPEIASKFESITGVKIFEGFGQSESCVLLATFPKWCKQRFGSMGLPCPLYDIRLLDNDENEVPIGAVGEICIKIKPGQVGLFYKYHNNEALTEATFATGIYHTGDLAKRDKDNYYWFVGRKDDIIKSSGYRIGPFEVESALIAHKAVAECAITGVPDELRGQIVKATIVLQKGYEPSAELIKELQNHVKVTTAPYKYPRVVEFVKELPKTVSGKIRRVEIREKDKQ